MLNENQGFLIPLFEEKDSTTFKPINRQDYPSDILITKGFPSIDERFNSTDLFILSSHSYDEEKSLKDGKARYWALGSDAENLPQNTLLPILITSLPDKQFGLLPQEITPPEQSFFILDDKILYGPIVSTQNDDKRYIIEPYVHSLLSYGKGYLGSFNIDDLDDIIVKITEDNTTMLFVSSFKSISKYKSKNIDYLSDDQLIKVVNAQGFGKKTQALGKKEAQRLQLIISESEKNNQIFKQQERIERLKQLLSRYLSESDIGYSLIKDYLGSNAGIHFLDNYIENNKSSILQEHLEKIRDEVEQEESRIRSNLKRLEDTLKDKEDLVQEYEEKVEQKKREVEQKIAEFEAEKEDAIKKQLEEKQLELSNEIEKSQANLSTIKKEISSKSDILKIANEAISLNKRKDYLEEHNIVLKSAADGYQDILRTTNNQDLARKIGEMEAINKVLNGQSYLDTTTFNAKPIIFTNNEPERIEDLIDSLCYKFLEDGGRSFSQAEMTNLIVSINQSFLTVLSGTPDTGKTSTATRLAEALHLGDSTGDKNFLFIPVGRGWVSSRDILGFYNSLKGVYQESRTGLYNFLQRKNNDTQKIILLDEANLSSMEHYWSDFIGLCDTDYCSRPIDTGIPKEELRFLNVDNSVKFIATINNDSTTEKLSPRLIDRAPIINLNVSSEIVHDITGKVLNGAIKTETLNKLFSVRDDTELSKASELILHRIIEHLSKRDAKLGNSIYISKRKINIITNYCSFVSPILDSEVAMDFAIEQHILPHIEGYGLGFKKRLEELSDILGRLYPRSSAQLERIITNGNEFTNSFSYF
ncbi:ATPase AAA [Moellerella wisconsensis]|nr:ATPase AAA [Moellerella wisconsensis]